MALKRRLKTMCATAYKPHSGTHRAATPRSGVHGENVDRSTTLSDVVP
jgi:hypothetical protein